MITHIIIKMHCKRRVQIHDLQGIFTACLRRSRTASLLTRWANAKPRRLFENIQHNRRRKAFYGFPQRSTELLATAQRAPRRSATFFERCRDAVRTPLWFDRAFSSNVYYEASHALVSCLVSPRGSKNPVINIHVVIFSVIKINNIVLISKPLLFDFAAIFWCDLILFACCCNVCIWNVHNNRYFALTLKALKRRRYVLFGCYPLFKLGNSVLIRTFVNDTLSSDCYKL